MGKIRLFKPNWGGQKEREIKIVEGEHYIKGSVYVDAGRRRLHIEDINVRSQGKGIGTRLMFTAVSKVDPDEVTGEVVDSRALKIRQKLGGSHTVNDIFGRELGIEEATYDMRAGGLRKVFVKTILR